MAKVKIGLNYFSVDTDRYQDIKIKRLKKAHGCQGLAVYDYVLCEIYRDKGCFLEWTEDIIFDVAEYLALTEDIVKQVVSFCASVGLFDEEKLTEGVVTSRSIQERYMDFCQRAKRKDAVIPENIKLTEKSEIIPEKSEIIPEESEKTADCSGSLPRREVNRSEENRIEVNNLPQDAHARGGNFKNLYQELSKHAQIPEDVWEAVAITGCFQNHWTSHYQQWLSEAEDTRSPLNELNQYLRKYCGDVNIDYYHAMGWCKDNLMQDQYAKIYEIVVSKPQALTELKKCIKEIKKGGINQPGLFIFSKLNKL
jgi:hypothetical protein